MTAETNDTSFDITRELRQTFAEVTMQHEAAALTQPRDWERVIALREETTRALKAERDTYLADYDVRVDKARQRLLTDADQPRFDHPAPWGAEPPLSIEARAHTEVRQAHEAANRSIEARETDAMSRLMSEAQNRDQVRGRVRDAFHHVADRRSGPDRRGPSQI
jgi:hypothetical protein